MCVIRGLSTTIDGLTDPMRSLEGSAAKELRLQLLRRQTGELGGAHNLLATGVLRQRQEGASLVTNVSKFG